MDSSCIADRMLEINQNINNMDISDSAKNDARKMFEEIQQFDLGRFLITNQGLNGYWTSYVINKAPCQEIENNLERWMIHEAPSVLATRERYSIFQKQIEKYIQEKSGSPQSKVLTVASVPAGTMYDLLNLKFHNVHVVGIDYDDKARLDALDNYNSLNHHYSNFDYRIKDAWDMQITEEFDLLVSNGLNIYEPNENKLIALYQEFYRSLKPNGILITSFLTSPADWDMEQINMKNLAKQKMLFSDILQAKWQCFNSEESVKKQLEIAGFKVIDIIYDKQKIFPTIVLQKE